MLKQRLLTALVLALFLTGVIFFLPTIYFSLIIGCGILLGAREWLRLANLQGGASSFVFMALILAGMLLSWWLYTNQISALQWIFVLALLWWCLAFLWLAFASSQVVLTSLPRLIRMGIGFLILVPSWLALTVMHGHETYGPAFVFFFLFVTSWADSGAYFMGRKFGRTKLAPVISPGKTWEGVAGGFVAVAVVVIIGCLIMQMTFSQFYWILAVSFIIVPFCIVGDLTESLVKRQAQVKDSGQLLPGHGGMLDRIDSVVAAAPVFMLSLLLLEKQF